MIHYIKGNVLDSTAPIIVHGCNCQGKMGSGVAKAVRDKYPEAYEAYARHHSQIGLELGYSLPVICKDGKIIVNAMTQEYYGYDKKLYTSYDAIREVCKFLALTTLVSTPIALPKIGCGLGGGDWGIVSEIIEEELPNHTIEVWEL